MFNSVCCFESRCTDLMYILGLFFPFTYRFGNCCGNGFGIVVQFVGFIKRFIRHYQFFSAKYIFEKGKW